MSNADLEAGIPLLTEMVAPAAPVFNAPPVSTPPALPIAPIAATIDTRQLELDITERVLQQLMLEVDSQLEPRMRDSLGEVLDAAVTVLAAEIRQTLQMTLADVVSAAVAQELEQHRFEKTKNDADLF